MRLTAIHADVLVEVDPSKTIQPSGIASGSTVGTPTIIATSDWLVFIAGTDRTSYIAVDSLRVQQEINSRDTASFTISDPEKAFRPTTGALVIIYKASARVFGGHIESTRERYEGGATLMKIEVSCVGFSALLARRFVAHHYVQGAPIIWSAASMMQDIIWRDLAGEGYGFNIGTGGDAALTENETFNYVSAMDAFDQLTKRVNRDWRVDFYRTIWLFDSAEGFGPCPFALTDANSGDWGDVQWTQSRGKYRNVQYVRNSRGLPPTRTETFAGDGVKQYFITDAILDDQPVVKVNGVEKIVQAYYAYSGSVHDFSYVPGGNGVFQNPSHAPLLATDTVTVTYPWPIEQLKVAEDAAQIAARAAVEGGTGRNEHLEEVKDFPIEGLTEFAEGLLDRYKRVAEVLEFRTRLSGAQPGLLLEVNTTYPPISGNYMIESVNTDEVAGRYLFHRIRAVSYEGKLMGKASAFFQRMLARDQQPLDRITYKAVIKLAKTVEGLTNPGLVAGLLKDSRTCEKAGFVRDVTLRWDTPPASSTVSVDVYLNGVSIFGTRKLSFATTDSGTIKRFVFASDPMTVEKGDVLTAEVLVADSTAKDGTLEVTIQG